MKSHTGRPALRLLRALAAGGLRPRLRWPVAIGLVAIVALVTGLAVLRPVGSVRANPSEPPVEVLAVPADEAEQAASAPTLAAPDPAGPATLTTTSGPVAPTTASPGTIAPGGIMTTSQTWTPAGSPYLVQSTVYLQSVSWTEPVTLTVEPGVEVRFAPGSSLAIVSLPGPDGIIPAPRGVLIAEGTPTQPITFTSAQPNPAPGDWGALYLAGPARLSYCDVGYGGSYPGDVGGGLVQVWANFWGTAIPGVEIRQCRIHDSGNEGIKLRGRRRVVLDDVELAGNAGVAISQDVKAAPSYSHLAFAGNGFDGVSVWIGPSYYHTLLEGHQHWGNGGAAGLFRVEGDLTIPELRHGSRKSKCCLTV